MDFGDGIKHELAVKTWNVRHLIEFNPATVDIAREVRICVIAVVLGFSVTTIVQSVLSHRRRLN